MTTNYARSTAGRTEALIYQADRAEMACDMLRLEAAASDTATRREMMLSHAGASARRAQLAYERLNDVPAAARMCAVANLCFAEVTPGRAS